MNKAIYLCKKNPFPNTTPNINTYHLSFFEDLDQQDETNYTIRQKPPLVNPYGLILTNYPIEDWDDIDPYLGNRILNGKAYLKRSKAKLCKSKNEFYRYLTYKREKA